MKIKKRIINTVQDSERYGQRVCNFIDYVHLRGPAASRSRKRTLRESRKTHKVSLCAPSARNLQGKIGQAAREREREREMRYSAGARSYPTRLSIRADRTRNRILFWRAAGRACLPGRIIYFLTCLPISIYALLLRLVPGIFFNLPPY